MVFQDMIVVNFPLWDENPVNWAPQNHSCSPNTSYEGLNVVATKDIAEGEELTLDYALFLDETMEPFACQCASHNCREVVVGTRMHSMSPGKKHLKDSVYRHQDILVPAPVIARLGKRNLKMK